MKNRPPVEDKTESYEKAIKKITAFLEKNIYSLLFLLTILSFIADNFLNLPYVDPDGYMRAIRIHNWLKTPTFFEQPILESNYPLGEISHWTRPMDILWLLCALPFLPFLPLKDALFTGGHLLSPLFCLLSVWVLTYGLKRCFNIWLVLTGCLIFLANPELQTYYAPNYPDHHSLMMLLSLVATAETLCWYKNPEKKHLLIIGITLALATLTAIEGILLFAIFLIPFILQYLQNRTTLSAAIEILTAYTLSLTLFWLLNPPYEGWLYPDNGRISILFISSAWLCCVGFYLINKYSPQTIIGKIIALASAGILTGIVLLLIFGMPILNPPIDTELNNIWGNRIIEMQSFAQFSIQKKLKYYAFAAIALLLNALLLKNKACRPLLILNLCWGIPLFALSLFAARFTAYQAVFIIIPYLVLIERIYQKFHLTTKKNNDFPATVWVVLIAIFLLETSAGLPSLLHKKETASPDINSPALCQNIKNIGGVLVTDVFFSPDYVWDCNVNTVGTPYHRNRDGIIDNHNILYAEDDNTLLALLQKHHVTQLLLFANYDNTYYPPDDEHKNKLYYRLLQRQDIPPFLTEITSPTENIRHYEVKYDVDFTTAPLESPKQTAIIKP